MLAIDLYRNSKADLDLGLPVWVDKFEPDKPAEATLIYVDDNRFNLAWMVSLIKRKKKPWAVLCTGFPFDVQAAWETRPFDVIIADVILPLVRATRWLYPYKDFLFQRGVAVIFTSASPEIEFWQMAALDGWEKNELCYYFEKPWDNKRLLQVIEKCLFFNQGTEVSGENTSLR